MIKCVAVQAIPAVSIPMGVHPSPRVVPPLCMITLCSAAHMSDLESASEVDLQNANSDDERE